MGRKRGCRGQGCPREPPRIKAARWWGSRPPLATGPVPTGLSPCWLRREVAALDSSECWQHAQNEWVIPSVQTLPHRKPQIRAKCTRPPPSFRPSAVPPLLLSEPVLENSPQSRPLSPALWLPVLPGSRKPAKLNHPLQTGNTVGAVVWPPPHCPPLLQLPCLQVKGTITVTFVPSGSVRSFQKGGVGRTFSEACILLCSLTFELSACQVKIQTSLQKVLYPWVEKYKIKITL